MAVLAGPKFLGPHPGRRWIGTAATFCGWGVGTYLATMLLWVLIPTFVLGWTPLVVVSDSMRPLIRAGDVVLVDEPGGMVGPGTVIAFEAGDDIVVHRVLRLDHDISYVTKGDANQGPDSTPVLSNQVVGRGRLLVPYLGMARVVPWVWWMGLAVLALALIPAWRWGTGWSAGVILALLVMVGIATASAVFSQATLNLGSSVSAIELDPPTGLVASCGPIGAGNVQVDLSWNPSLTPDVTGYRILHDASGGGLTYSPVGTVGPTMTSFAHTVSVAILGLGAHTYVVQSVLGSWSSEHSTSDSVNITQVLVVYVCS